MFWIPRSRLSEYGLNLGIFCAKRDDHTKQNIFEACWFLKVNRHFWYQESVTSNIQKRNRPKTRQDNLYFILSSTWSWMDEFITILSTKEIKFYFKYRSFKVNAKSIGCTTAAIFGSPHEKFHSLLAWIKNIWALRLCESSLVNTYHVTRVAIGFSLIWDTTQMLSRDTVNQSLLTSVYSLSLSIDYLIQTC